jgi:hypothetical protein
MLMELESLLPRLSCECALPWVSLLATQLVKKRPQSRLARPLFELSYGRDVSLVLEQAIRPEPATELAQYNRM